MFPPSVVQFYPGRLYRHLCRVKTPIKAAARALPHKHLGEQQQKVVENTGHKSCTRNGNYS